ncbi:MAG: hypothetical protein E6447_11905, partial [Bradyrhizobium sp.]|nr:hypothetical protein [Bradyrhizobium sp.]
LSPAIARTATQNSEFYCSRSWITQAGHMLHESLELTIGDEPVSAPGHMVGANIVDLLPS